MKKLAIATFLALMISSFAFDASAFDGLNLRKRRHPRPGHHNPVGAPLDGGLLALLGAAGIGYYLIRKKKAES